jgi:peroxiredoxin
MDGKPFKLGDVTPGKVTVIQFYAGACCDDQLPGTNRVFLDGRADGVSVLAVNVLDPEEVVREQIDRLGLAFQVALDPMRVTVKRYDVLRLPTTFLIDAGGIVRAKIVGQVSEGDLARRVNKILNLSNPENP